MLAKINGHPRDEHVQFFEEPHIYKIHGWNGNVISVTTFIHKFFPEFNSEVMAEKVILSGNVKYQGMTKEEIIEMWKKNGRDASSLGTAMHKAIEEYINSPCTLPETIEIRYFLNFWDHITSLGYTPYRTEWIVYDEHCGIAGSIDFVLRHPQGGFVVCDWKRSKEIKCSNKWSKGYPPLDHLDDCNLHHYALQLNCYRNILEKYYGILVVRMIIVILHPNNQNYVMIDVPRIQEEIDAMWVVRQKEII